MMRGAARSINRANETSPAYGGIIPLDTGKCQTKTADFAQPDRAEAIGMILRFGCAFSLYDQTQRGDHMLMRGIF